MKTIKFVLFLVIVLQGKINFSQTQIVDNCERFVFERFKCFFRETDTSKFNMIDSCNNYLNYRECAFDTIKLMNILWKHRLEYDDKYDFVITHIVDSINFVYKISDFDLSDSFSSEKLSNREKYTFKSIVKYYMLLALYYDDFDFASGVELSSKNKKRTLLISYNNNNPSHFGVEDDVLVIKNYSILVIIEQALLVFMEKLNNKGLQSLREQGYDPMSDLNIQWKGQKNNLMDKFRK